MKLLLLAVLGAALSQVAALSYPAHGPKPGDFAFPPSGYESKKPGEILRQRKVEMALFGSARINADAWQVLYRSNALNSSDPMAAVTTIVVPKHARNDRLILHQAIEDAASYRCRPSADLVHSFLPKFDSIIERIELLLVSVYLEQGWVVSIADYEGPMSAFAVGQISAHAVLDGGRAALNFKESGLDRSKVRIAGVGYSGGAIGAGWAAQMHDKYAPELNIVGWTIGGTPANISNLVQEADGKFTSGLLVLGATGLLNGHPELQGTAEKYLTAEGWKAIGWGRSVCAVLGSAAYAFQRIQSSRYIRDGLGLDQIPHIGPLLNDLTMGANGLAPKAPVFMFHAVTDEFIPYQATRDSARLWCDNGANVEFVTELLGLEHIATYIATFSRVMGFIEDRFSGKPLKSRKCQFKTMLTPALNPVDDLRLGGYVWDVLKTLLGQATGNPAKANALFAAAGHGTSNKIHSVSHSSESHGHSTKSHAHSTKSHEHSTKHHEHSVKGYAHATTSHGHSKASASHSHKSSSTHATKTHSRD